MFRAVFGLDADAVLRLSTQEFWAYHRFAVDYLMMERSGGIIGDKRHTEPPLNNDAFAIAVEKTKREQGRETVSLIDVLRKMNNG